MEPSDRQAGSPNGWTLLEELRPEVLQGHAGLLRRLGTSLPPATRQLLFVHAFVLQGSARGLRRHAARALAAGAERDHIVDAVVMALPVAGPSRVAEALDALRGLLTHCPDDELAEW